MIVIQQRTPDGGGEQACGGPRQAHRSGTGGADKTDRSLGQDTQESDNLQNPRSL